MNQNISNLDAKPLAAEAPQRILRRAIGMAIFTLLTIVGAKIRIYLPFTPVPMTLQTLFVPLAGAFLGAGWGAGSMVLYLALGLVGVDVFAAASTGNGLLFAPTAGYLVGFVAAAAIAGWLTYRNPSHRKDLGAIVLAHVAIFVCGIAGLMINAHYSLSTAVEKGVLPFLLGDSLKTVASFLILTGYRVFRPKA
ncbi:MAG TPA: biotin transporter BioY [Acidobacteriota bacterium]|nr:biotin transporter BioY [Acidobacteriota bacterium]